jgi:hypothetical protein
MVSVVYPGVYDYLKDYIHPCPYLPVSYFKPFLIEAFVIEILQGRYFLQQTIDTVYIPEMMEPRDYKSFFRIADRKNKTIGAGYASLTIKLGYPPSNRRRKN